MLSQDILDGFFNKIGYQGKLLQDSIPFSTLKPIETENKVFIKNGTMKVGQVRFPVLSLRI